MSQRIKFFCKLSKNKKNGTKVFVHSICRTAKSVKYVFANEERPLTKHLKGVQDTINTANVKSKRNLDYKLKGTELAFTSTRKPVTFGSTEKSSRKLPLPVCQANRLKITMNRNRKRSTTSRKFKRQVAVFTFHGQFSQKSVAAKSFLKRRLY